MQLKKLSDTHYVVVSDEPIKMDDWYLDDTNSVRQAITECESYWTYRKNYKKITHSTEPLDKALFFTDKVWGCERLSLGDVKELIEEVDVEKKAKECVGYYDKNDDRDVEIFIKGYNQCLEDNKDKRFSEYDMRMAMDKMSVVSYSSQFGMSSKFKERKKYIDNYISSLTQPKDTWECEFINGQLKLKHNQ